MYIFFQYTYIWLLFSLLLDGLNTNSIALKSANHDQIDTASYLKKMMIKIFPMKFYSPWPPSFKRANPKLKYEIMAL